jgi:hypothetical protein
MRLRTKAMTDLRTGVHPEIWWYIVVDTSWLLAQSPTPADHVVFPARKVGLNKWELFAVRYLLPSEVKKELAKLHVENHDHRQIANARRWLTQLFSLTNKPWERSRILEDTHGSLGCYYATHDCNVEYGYVDMVRGLPLLSCSEVDILDLPQFKTEEGNLCADSQTDRQILTLARMIASPPWKKNCFISTRDTGIEAEVASLFYKRGLSIGCLATLSDYMKSWDNTFALIT